MTRAMLALGSNMGDRMAHLQGAVDGLAATTGVAVTAVSPVYETDPVGGPPQDDYLNAVVQVDASLQARGLLWLAYDLEATAARVRREHWGPRTLDVDVIWIDGEAVDEPDLVVPHPLAGERPFVLAPMADLDADLAAALARIDDWTAGVRRVDGALTLPP